MSDRKAEGQGPVLRDISDQEAQALCNELRRELIQDVARTGGHLASNLGAVELTVAIHRVFDTSRDRLVFDVGHQCYSHKMLTGRREQMETLRRFGGIAGFPKPEESVHDAFVAGHASNSVAVALGMARARTLMGEDYHVLALIGDGALTGGLAYEGLCNAGHSGEQLLVILNDNGMSITKSVGGMADYLAKQRLKPQYLTFKKHYRRIMHATWLGRRIYRVTHGLKKALKESMLPSSMFENMGFTYLGPIDGHEVGRLTRTLRYAKELNEPVLLHIRTTKGFSYPPAEENPDAYHGVGPFDPETGRPLKPHSDTFSDVFGRSLIRLAREDDRVCAITAAMEGGTGLSGFARAFPKRFFDVGIAEGAAVSMAAGMAKQGLIPVFAVYSTFLQRGYDMLIHDVAISGLHVVLEVDRAGLVGDDGETHHGVFDVAYLDSVPGMTVLAPSNFAEMDRMLGYAVKDVRGPVAIHCPRGGQGAYVKDSGPAPAVTLREGQDITLVSYGTMINETLQAAAALEERGVSAQVIKLNLITPLDPSLVAESVKRTGVMLVAEESVQAGSVGVRLAAALELRGIKARVALCNSGERFTPHGSPAQLKELLGLDAQGLLRRSLEVLGNG